MPGLYICASCEVLPGGMPVQEKGAFEGEGGDDDEAQEVENSISGNSAFNYTEMPFGSKTEMKEWIKGYVNSVRQCLKVCSRSRSRCWLVTRRGLPATILTRNRSPALLFLM